MLADQIAKLIEEMLEQSGGSLELQRNELAQHLGCVPSQISYVITSRFTPERGYLIESRRGGGGCIRIVRKQMHRDEYLMHFFYAIGEQIEENEAKAYLRNLLDQEIITPREGAIINNALSNAALQNVTPEGRSTVRAQIFRHILLSLMH
ncbi:MAG: CtsR family transcriptional regulator [Ruminococcaceae bacterium]|nr:CtsR family transcriptional regulator [Oscillospiraceae bacterium]